MVLALCSAGARAAEVSGVLVGRHRWSGEVRVGADVWVPPGSELVIDPGTRVVFAEAVSTKTDPALWQPGTELAVAGVLDVLGSPDDPVRFEGEGPWGGLVVGPGGQARIKGARVIGADEGVLVAGGVCVLDDVVVEGGDTGLVTASGSGFSGRQVRLVGNRIGWLDLRGASTARDGVSVEDFADAERLAPEFEPLGVVPVGLGPLEGPRIEYLGEYTVSSSETWRGEVVVSGRITVVPEAVLTLAPGTRVRFRRIDTNGDGLGEGELLVLGGIRSLGTPARPVVFESAEDDPRPGDWGKVSLVASEDPDNRFESTVIRHGVQALHAHFSRFTVVGCYFERNVRALQFQESEGATVRNCVFRANKQGLRFRDSVAQVTGNVFIGNDYAVHAFRCDLVFRDNVLVDNRLGGFLAKESQVIFAGNLLDGNRDGARLKDPDSRVQVRANRFGPTAETALALSRVEGVVEHNRFEGAGLDLVALEDAPVALVANHFGEAGRDAVHLEGSIDVTARGNRWDGDPDGRIHDGNDEEGVGRVFRESGVTPTETISLREAAW